MSEIWALGDYEQIALRFAPIHDRLVDALAPAPGELWLDVATGTGEVALRAARAGAAVTALDFSDRLLDAASRKAEAEGLAIDFVLGDAQSLPFGDAAFDVVSSSFGIIFPPDRVAIASELARVVRPGGRLGLTVWRARPEQSAIYERFTDGDAPPDHADWGRDGFVEELLGDAFALELGDGVWHIEHDSPAALYEFMSSVAPPTIAFLERLSPRRRDEFRETQLRYWEQFTGTAGHVREPWRYRLVEGRRR